MHPFLNYDDLAQTLHQVVGMYRGVPVFITTCGQGKNNYVRVKPLVGGRNNYKEIVVTDPELELHTFNLGYVNFYLMYGDIMSDVYYIERGPVRRWKQGLHHHNLLSDGSPITNNLLKSRGFADMLRGVYPSYTKVHENVVMTGQSRGGAFCEDLAIKRGSSNTCELHFQGAPIMMLNDQTGHWGWLPGNEHQRSFYKILLDKYGVSYDG